MLRQCCVQRLKYLPSVRATSSVSVVPLLQHYQEDGSRRRAANVPSSQRYFYEARKQPRPRNGAEPDQLSQRHQMVQLRLGEAQLLASTAGHITNNNEAHPLFYAQTSPREAGLCMALVLALKRLRIRQLTELQGALVPLMLKGKHIIAHAETGTGKSFGIALAIANRILRNQLNYRLHTIVLVPTEELALQYDKWFRHFGGCSSQIVQVAIDSIPLETQLAKLHNIQPHVLVGTPQRIADITRLSPTIVGEKLRRKVDCVVLDEADLVLTTPVQYGRQAITGTNLVDRLFRSRQDEVPAQLVAASATVDGVTAQTLNTWTRNDKAVRLTTSFVEHTIPPTLNFYFFAAQTDYPLHRSLELILRLICRQEAHPRVLLFTDADEVAALSARLNDTVLAHVPEAQRFIASGSKPRRFAAELHSLPTATAAVEDATQRGHDGQARGRRSPSSSSSSERDGTMIRPGQIVLQKGNVYVKNSSTLSMLNEGNLLVGVGAFEMSRGLHVNGITHVILHGECPSSTHFVHCAGRTGRMGAEGDVIVLFPPSSGRTVQQVCQSLELPFVPGKMAAVEQLLGDDDFASSTSLQSLKEGNEKMEADLRRQQLAYFIHDSSTI